MGWGGGLQKVERVSETSNGRVLHLKVQMGAIGRLKIRSHKDINKKEIQQFATMWMDLVNIMLSTTKGK